MSENDSGEEFLIPPKPGDLVILRNPPKRRFMKKVYRMQCSSERLSMLDSKSPKQVLNMVMRKGKLDMGANGDLVKCPCKSNPAACFVVSDPRPDESNVFCCGVAVEQKEKGLLSKETVFETFNLFSMGCGYWPFKASSSRVTDQQRLFHYVLKRCSDVEVSDDAYKANK